jgi:hypothetical protein
MPGRVGKRAVIHQLLQNPTYCGDFEWLGRTYHGHIPIAA